MSSLKWQLIRGGRYAESKPAAPSPSRPEPKPPSVQKRYELPLDSRGRLMCRDSAKKGEDKA